MTQLRGHTPACSVSNFLIKSCSLALHGEQTRVYEVPAFFSFVCYSDQYCRSRSGSYNVDMPHIADPIALRRFAPSYYGPPSCTHHKATRFLTSDGAPAASASILLFQLPSWSCTWHTVHVGDFIYDPGTHGHTPTDTAMQVSSPIGVSKRYYGTTGDKGTC